VRYGEAELTTIIVGAPTRLLWSAWVKLLILLKKHIRQIA